MFDHDYDIMSHYTYMAIMWRLESTKLNNWVMFWCIAVYMTSGNVDWVCYSELFRLLFSSCTSHYYCAIFRRYWPGCEGVVRPAPEGAGRMMQSESEGSEGFDVIIRPAPEDAGRTTLEQPGHYSHYNTKLANSRYVHGNSWHIALTENGVVAILFLEIYWALSLPPYLNSCISTGVIK